MDKGILLKQLREQKGMGQTEAARYLGISKQTLYKYENDIVTNIPSDVIERIAALYETSPAVIMGWETTREVLIDAYAQNDFKNSITGTELEILRRYRISSPEAQSIIKKILGMETEVPTLKRDIG